MLTGNSIYMAEAIYEGGRMTSLHHTWNGAANSVLGFIANDAPLLYDAQGQMAKLAETNYIDLVTPTQEIEYSITQVEVQP